MQMRRIGSLEVSVVGLGCNNFGWRLDARQSERVVHAALDAGVTLFDTADMYGANDSERFLGQALRGRRAIIATKFGHAWNAVRKGAHPDNVRAAVEESLQRLQVDCIDLYQLHMPDPTVSIADTLGALAELVKAGKVREIGCSQFTLAMLEEAQAVLPPGAPRFESVQNEYSLLHREPEAEVLPYCARERLAFLPFFPLANGLLTGKYRGARPEGARLSTSESHASRELTPERVARVERLAAFAESRGHSMLELAMSWLVSNEAVTSVIAGATTEEQVRSNVAAAAWRLTAEERATVAAL